MTDPFSSLLSLAGARAAVAGGLHGGGAWKITFPAPDKIKVMAILRGECWFQREGEPPVRLRAGDVFMHTTPRPFVLASDLASPALEAHALFADERTPWLGEGDDFFMLGVHVTFDSEHGRQLIDNLPANVHLQGDRTQPVRWLIEQLLREYESERAGVEFATAQLAQLVFVHVLRALLDEPGTLSVGRLRALSDPRIAGALRAIHGEPSRDWQLAELARRAGMSRTAFALYFKSVAGVAPLAYLTEWRMRLAERALREGDDTVAQLAETLGYASESAFSTAFKRVTGYAPSHFRARRAS